MKLKKKTIFLYATFIFTILFMPNIKKWNYLMIYCIYWINSNNNIETNYMYVFIAGFTD